MPKLLLILLIVWPLNSMAEVCTPVNEEVEALRFEDNHFLGTTSFYKNADAARSTANPYQLTKLHPQHRLTPNNDRDFPPTWLFSTGDGVTTKVSYHMVPAFATLMRAQLSGPGKEAYYEVLRVLGREPGGMKWFAKHVSREIRSWLENQDYELYQNQIPLNVPKEESSRAEKLPPQITVYQLPDGGLVYLKEDARDLIRRRWAEDFRPGNM